MVICGSPLSDSRLDHGHDVTFERMGFLPLKHHLPYWWESCIGNMLLTETGRMACKRRLQEAARRTDDVVSERLFVLYVHNDEKGSESWPAEWTKREEAGGGDSRGS